MSNAGAKNGRTRTPKYMSISAVAVLLLVAASFFPLPPEMLATKRADVGFAAHLPSKIYTVVGLESSGTHFVSGLLAEALQTGPYRDGCSTRQKTGDVQVQHMSLPQVRRDQRRRER
mmetsp:Transcript_26748/g.61569  ORF Transcript_26748/g.61569 Transcript_26748/m.61569 type:complete len:117 (-) Transcript_26748:1501-1851(-)|eukprot:CAMPEP_0113322280 /NCGR_PEP_ID=MMETSP0010_2-20120614/15496_1 /TAXON_ID=216773 ORGANISM="Corethron hystrix, Strain 308" /NCGR_SAMPLE_ID=MMETSP0010_2 /ASSEMBLY_ACC=CAM_ASM_000155 /LENGTH=116 /DNA_ID=CAMNT_0000180719 /DNA_START=77 /DNA_END=427 /DNA_ORIENTATION=- /assembly_acc=CAM_ASM_000155